VEVNPPPNKVGGFCELTHPTYDRLTRANAVLLLVDHQVGLIAGALACLAAYPLT
jgi:hypothetical protein